MRDWVQPDLLGEPEPAAAPSPARWQRPAQCPACGTREPTGLQLRNNHGIAPGEEGVYGFPPGRHPVYGAMCAAQHYVTNHITYYVRHPNPERLAEAMRRGRKLRLDVDAVVIRALNEEKE